MELVDDPRHLDRIPHHHGIGQLTGARGLVHDLVVVPRLHRMADDLGWEAVILVTVGRWCIRMTSVAHQAGVGQAAQQVDNALVCKGWISEWPKSSVRGMNALLSGENLSWRCNGQ